MLDIKTLKLGIIQENCYLIETDDCLIAIDPGYYSSEISDFLNKNNKEKLILITHAHFDHIGAVSRIKQETGAMVGIGNAEKDSLNDSNMNLSKKFHIAVEKIFCDFTFESGETKEFGTTKIKSILTSGHTKGSVCYLIEDKLFSGDTLFFESYGRIDFPGGSQEDMMESFYKLCSILDDDTEVFPGHGQKTTIGHEREENPLCFWGA